MAQFRDTCARPSAERETVALLCPEPRWRRVLALALEADGLLVCDWPLSGQASDADPAIVIADLDSLGWQAADAIGRVGVDTPILLISVYPQQLDDLKNGRPVAALQPPFRWREFTRRVRCLLLASRPPQT